MWLRLPWFLVGPGLVLALVALASLVRSMSPEWLTRDPAVMGGLHPLVGALSHLGVLLWCAAASACLFAASRLRGDPLRAEDRRRLLAAAALTAALLLDDLFLGHDDLVKRYFGRGELFVVLPLMGGTLAYLLRFRPAIVRDEPALLAFALASFAVSLALDRANDFGWLGGSGWSFYAEDAPKFLGICAWCGYHWQSAAAALAPATPPRTARPAGTHAVVRTRRDGGPTSAATS